MDLRTLRLSTLLPPCGCGILHTYALLHYPCPSHVFMHTVCVFVCVCVCVLRRAHRHAAAEQPEQLHVGEVRVHGPEHGGRRELLHQPGDQL